jgi:hypothetical protein
MYSNLSSLLNELSELGVLISDTQDLLKQVPNDTIVEFQLEQLKHRQSELNNELRALSINEKRQVFEYHFLCPFESGVSINDIAKCFNALSSVFDALAKKELTYYTPPDLELRAVVNQSFGLVFTSKQVDQIDMGELVSDMNKTEQVINEFMILTEALNEKDDLISVFHDQHRQRETISAINKFYESIYSNGNDIVIEWISPFQSKGPKSLKVTSERARYISNFIKTRKTIPDETVTLFGELGGISIYKKRIEFLQTGSTKPIVVKWSEDLLTTITELKLKHYYHITCIVSSLYDASTESLKMNYMLKQISE